MLLGLALGGCERGAEDSPPAGPASARAAANTMDCVADRLAFKGKGEQVGVASFGLTADALSIGLTLTVDQGGRTHVLSSSLLSLPPRPGTYHFPALDKPGTSLAHYHIRTPERDPILSYEGSTYGMAYSPVENDPAAKLQLEVDKLAVSPGKLPGFKRVDMAGRFAFNAAALPGSEPSDACTKEALERGMRALPSGKRPLPMYDAGVCGARKVHVQCGYRISQELLLMDGK